MSATAIVPFEQSAALAPAGPSTPSRYTLAVTPFDYAFRIPARLLRSTYRY
jgi:hypothetical protein